MATRVTSKGQVTIPKRVRDHLGILPGHLVDFEMTDDGEVTLTKLGRRRRAQSRFDRIRGSATIRISTEEIMKLTRGG
ncbi:MAG: AbrB/MazE/SpoVT family DNA-binding domain-containing protein [Proteobacteria bacterium]|nr:AbrB/MazE/SpoVT family DNA-binding domain-containing protein [Pseudomonadota bacterium]